MTRRQAQAVRIVVVATAYAVVGGAALELDAVEGFATLVWPPTGMALAAVLALGPGVVPGIALGAFAANAWQGAPWHAALGIAIGNSAEAYVGGYLLRRAGLRTNLARLSDVLSLVALGALLSTTLSATLGPLSLHFALAQSGSPDVTTSSIADRA